MLLTISHWMLILQSNFVYEDNSQTLVLGAVVEKMVLHYLLLMIFSNATNIILNKNQTIF